jgi:hypothetical protein
VVSRQLERIGDNAVDIGEQVAFLVTGQFRESTDASHPEIEHPALVDLGDAAQADEHKPRPLAELASGLANRALPDLGTRRTGPEAAGAGTPTAGQR